MLYRGRWLTSYTPITEVSQGTCQSIFEFRRTSASDGPRSPIIARRGASALVEALLMARRLSRGPGAGCALGRGFTPSTARRRTYFANLDSRSCEVPLVADGATEAAGPSPARSTRPFAVAVSPPNVFGIVEDGSRSRAPRGPVPLVAVVAEAASLALLAPPGEGGADIACGEAQSLGVPMHNGGPLLGFLSCRTEHQRQIPGRLVGETRDAEGRRAFCLTLSTREQHIRREKATSNICTNQGLMALASNIHMSLLGKKGLREIALQSHAKAEYLKGEIAKVPGYRISYPGPTFNEFVVEGPEEARALLSRLAGQKILAGIPLSRWNPEDTRRFLVAVTEMNQKGEMDRLAAALAGRAA